MERSLSGCPVPVPRVRHHVDSAARIRAFCTSALAAVIAFATLVSLPAAVHAQGVTTGAISGTVTDQQNQPIGNAEVRITNRSTGYATTTLTRANGLYLMQGLEVGGPYAVEVSQIGYATVTREDIYVRLSATTRVDIQLSAQAVQLEGLDISVARAADFSPTRQGVSTIVSDTLLRRIPTLSRDFLGLVKLTPQVVQPANDGPSAGGTWNRFNTFTIDGANQSERFNLGSSGGVPGGATGAKLISIDAVKEFRVQLTPTDVRQGNFVGMLVNAVTKSGTNEFHGGATLAYRDESLAAEPLRENELNIKQYGFQLGGPIIRDRLHFYIAPEWQDRDSPAAGPYFTSAGGRSPAPDTSSVPLDSIRRIQQIVDQQYSRNAGTEQPITLQTPLRNLFGRIDFAINENHRAVLRQLINRAEDRSFSRNNNSLNTSPSVQNSGFRLGSNQFDRVNTNNSTVFQLYSNFAGGMSNELIVGYNTIKDERLVPFESPEVAVGVNVAGTVRAVTFGTEQFSPDNLLEQDIFEVVNNFTMPIGRHTVTFGGRFDHTNIFNNFAQRLYGVYVFPTIDALQAGQPSGFSVGYDNSGTGRGIPADFSIQQYSLYAQDVWSVNDNLTLTYGLRADIPRQLDTPLFNDSLFARTGIRTDQKVKTQVLFSPRVGFNYDPTGDQRNQVRGNLGIFTSAPPYILLGNAYANTGLGLVTLVCTGDQTPAFTMEVDQLPRACAGSNAPAPGAAGTAGINLNDPDFKYPQYLATSFGFDRLLPFNTVLTVEAMYRKSINGILIRDRNLTGPRLVGGQPYTDRDGRVLYADTISATGSVNNNNQRLIPTSGSGTAGLRGVTLSEGLIEVTNQSEDYNYTLTGQLSRRFSDVLEATVAYTYMQSKDVQSFTSDRAISNWRNGRQLANAHEELEASTSVFERPHRIVAYGTWTLPWKLTDISLYYEGISGNPVSYVANGDLNGDGYNGNDLIYVPRDATDPAEIRIGRGSGNNFALHPQDAAAFEQFIESQSCLDEQRGSIMERNSCTAPFQHRMDLSIRQSIPQIRGQQLTLQLDVFNFLNLLKDEWGQIELPTLSPTFNDQRVLVQQGRTAGALSQSQSNFTFDNRVVTNGAFGGTTTASNYQIQLTLRYAF